MIINTVGKNTLRNFYYNIDEINNILSTIRETKEEENIELLEKLIELYNNIRKESSEFLNVLNYLKTKIEEY